MSKPFEGLLAQIQAEWSDETWRVYASVSKGLAEAARGELVERDDFLEDVDLGDDDHHPCGCCTCCGCICDGPGWGES